MIILGIDPGLTVTGFSIIKKDKQKLILLDAGALKFSSKDSISKRIAIFYNALQNKITKFNINTIALETPFLGKNAQVFLKLGYLRGILYLLAEQNDIILSEFSPRQVKLSLTGFGGAQKEQVARIILKLFPGFSMPQKLDITDAIAVAICSSWRSQICYNL